MNNAIMKKLLAEGLVFAAMFAQAATEIVIDPGIGKYANVTEKLTGTTDVRVSSGFVTLNGSNDYTGKTTVTNGTLIVTNAAASGWASSIGASGDLDILNGVLRYDGTAGATLGHNVICSTPVEDCNTSAACFDLRKDIRFVAIDTGYSPFVKVGDGAMILEGESDTAAFNFMSKDNNNGIDKHDTQFVMPADGTAPKTGFSTVGFLRGKVILNRGKINVQKTNKLTVLGGWTANEGEQEGDFELVLNAGVATISTSQTLGQLHGFKDYNTPNGSAKAYITVNSGATYNPAGGQSFIMGSADAAPKIGGIQRCFNTDLKLEINGGTYTHYDSRASFKVYQRPGQASRVIVNAGTFQDYLVYVGEGVTNDDTTAYFTFDMTNGAKVINQEWFNNYAKGENQPPVQLNVTGGSAFYTHRLVPWDTSKPGNMSICLDNGILGAWSGSNSVSYSQLTLTQRKLIAPAGLVRLEIGEGGAKLVAQGTSNIGSLPNIAIYEKGFSTAANLVAAGKSDGGVTIESASSEHMVELSGASTYSGPTVLKSGTLTFVGNGSISDASVFTAKPGTILYVSSNDVTLCNAVFENRSVIKITRGKKLVITGSVNFSSGVQLVLVNADGTEITDDISALDCIVVPESQKSKLLALKVNGICSSRLYFSGSNITIAGGRATFSVSLAQRTDVENPTETTAVWKGVGTDDALTTAANWGNATVPVFDGGCLATFAEANGRAVVSGEKAFRGIRLGDNSFTFANDNTFAFILLKAAGLQFETPTAANTLKFEVPVESEVEQNWELPANARVEFADRVRFAAKVKSQDFGAGNIVFSGGDVRAANLRLASTNMTVFFTGHIDNLDESVSTTAGVADAGTLVLNSPTEAMSDAGIQRNVLSNAVFRKAVYVVNGLSDLDVFHSMPNTTNIFKGCFQTMSPYRYLNFGTNSTTIFDCPMHLGWSMGTRGTGTVIFRKPLNQGDGRFQVESACTVKFETTGNNWHNRLSVRADGARVEYLVDDTFATVGKDSYLDLADGNNCCTNDIFATTQHFPKIYSRGQNPLITGEYGSKIVITTGAAADTASYDNNRICCRVEGGVSLEIDSTASPAGDLVLENCDFASGGDLIATKGTLRLENGATWLNGTNFIARGCGKLKFSAANQVNANFAVLHMEGGGKVEIPAGITNCVYEAKTNGVGLAWGDYTGQGGPAGATVIPQLTGTGVLSVRHDEVKTRYAVVDPSEQDVHSVVVSNGWVTENVPSDKTIFDAAANGFPYWKCYVLGLKPNDPNSVPLLKGVQNADPGRLAFMLENVKYNSSSGVAVTYAVEESTSIGGTYTERKTANAGELAVFDIPTEGTLHYYRAEIRYRTAE